MKKTLLLAVTATAVAISNTLMAEGVPMVSGHSDADHFLIGRRPCQCPFLKEVQEELDRLEYAPGRSDVTVNQQRFTLSVVQGTDADGNPQLEYTVYHEDEDEGRLR